jgi:hypothetical protein
MNRGMTTLAATILLATGCGSGSSMPQANSCATSGATYVETFTQTSGNCGPLSSQVINVSPSGTLTVPTTISCTSSTQAGCTIQESDCTYSADGFDYTYSSSVTFASDGSSFAGTYSVSGTGMGMSCASSYSISGTRQ